MDFTREELDLIKDGAHPDWEQIGDESRYGGVFKSPKYPGKVIKIQSGDYDTYKNEVDKQFRAQLGNAGDYEVPSLGETGFIPDDPSTPKWTDPNSGIKGFHPRQSGISFISMDEADFSDALGGSRSRAHAHAKGLLSLYKNALINHADDHSGNIKFNPKTGKAVILDYGLARSSSDPYGKDKRDDWIQAALRNTDNTDILDTWNKHHSQLMLENLMKRTEESAAALEDWKQQGLQVALMTDPTIAPANWSDDSYQTPAIDREVPLRLAGDKFKRARR